MSKKHVIIVDLDGTLCNVEHRRHFIDKKDWTSFYEHLVDDEPNEWCRHLIARFDQNEVLFVSGRPDTYRKETLKWLDDRGYGGIPVFMRKEGDYRQDAVVKEEIYREHIEPYYNILFCVDDRQQVVDMWRRIGLVCLQCDKGDF